MKTQAILPVLQFFGRNKALLDLNTISAKLKLHPTVVMGMVIDAELNLPIGYQLDDRQLLILLDMGTQLGVIHFDTEMEIVPLQAKLTVNQYRQPEDAGAMEAAERILAVRLADELRAQNVITFVVTPWQQTRQRIPGERDWVLNASLKVLKEK